MSPVACLLSVAIASQVSPWNPPHHQEGNPGSQSQAQCQTCPRRTSGSIQQACTLFTSISPRSTSLDDHPLSPDSPSLYCSVLPLTRFNLPLFSSLPHPWCPWRQPTSDQQRSLHPLVLLSLLPSSPGWTELSP